MGVSVIAIIAGIIGLRRPKKPGDKFSNGFAWVGIVWASVVLLILLSMISRQSVS